MPLEKMPRKQFEKKDREGSLFIFKQEVFSLNLISKLIKFLIILIEKALFLWKRFVCFKRRRLILFINWRHHKFIALNETVFNSLRVILMFVEDKFLLNENKKINKYISPKSYSFGTFSTNSTSLWKSFRKTFKNLLIF